MRRWLAQLPSHVPVGLQERRTTRLQAESIHAVYRHVLADRMGVRSEDSARRSGGQKGPAHRRRNAQANHPNRIGGDSDTGHTDLHQRVRLDRQRFARRRPADGSNIQEKRLVWNPVFHILSFFFFSFCILFYFYFLVLF